MTSFQLAQISDTHLSRIRPHFVANYEVAATAIADHKPDLVVHSGDIALDALTRPDDLSFAKEVFEALPVPTRAIAGNHDVGDNPGDNGYQPSQPVTSAHIDAFGAVFGTSHWHVEEAGWCILGVNAQLFLSGLSEEEQQMIWLQEVLEKSIGKPVAIFCHKPLLRDAMEEPIDVPYRYVPLATRPKIHALMKAAKIRLFACGHVHQSRDHFVDGIRHVWAPATAFTLPDDVQPRVGTKRCGFVRYVFTPDDFHVETVFPDAMEHHPLDVLKDAYA